MSIALPYMSLNQRGPVMCSTCDSLQTRHTQRAGDEQLHPYRTLQYSSVQYRVELVIQLLVLNTVTLGAIMTK